MGRAFDPARAMRERLKILEAREKGRSEAHAVAQGVAETVALSQARGAAIEKTPAERGGRDTPYQRRAGLDWLAAKGKISEAQRLAGERYGACYWRAGAHRRWARPWTWRPRAARLAVRRSGCC